MACRPIARGDEITISYVDLRTQLESRRILLQRHYSFDCICRVCTDPDVQQDMARMRDLDDEILSLGCVGQAELAMFQGTALLELYSKYGMSSWHSYRTHYDMFQMAVTS